jgi:hypothetical protein
MVMREEVVAMFPREEAGGLTSEAWNAEAEKGKRKRPNSGKPEAGARHLPGWWRQSWSRSQGRREGWPLARRHEPGSRPGRRRIDG